MTPLRLFLAPALTATLYLLIAGGLALSEPDVAALRENRPSATPYMLSRAEEWERDSLRRDAACNWVPLSRVSPYVVGAVLAERTGVEGTTVDPRQAWVTAAAADLPTELARSREDPLAMGLARLLLPTGFDPARPLRETLLAWRIRRHLPPERVLELYLNFVEWGPGVFGIEAASRTYFGKSCRMIGPFEASRLAAVLDAPLGHDPLDPPAHVRERARLIFRTLLSQHMAGPRYKY